MKYIQRAIDFFNKKSLLWASKYPKAWSLGWLTQLTIAVVLYSLTILVAFTIPMKNTYAPDVRNWFSFAFIPVVFWWLFIVYRLVKYNSEKLFGNRSKWHNFIELPTYIIQFLMPLFIPLALSFIINERVANLIEESELSSYKIAFEEAEPFFTHSYGSSDYINYRDLTQKIYDRAGVNFDYYEDDTEFCNAIFNSQNYRSDFTQKYQDYRRVLEDSIRYHKGVFRSQRPRLYPDDFHNFNYTRDKLADPFKTTSYRFVGDSLQKVYFHYNQHDDAFVKSKFRRYLQKLSQFDNGKKVDMTEEDLFYLFENNIYHQEARTELYSKVKELDKRSNIMVSQIDYMDTCKDRNYQIFQREFYWFMLLFASMWAIFFATFKNMDWREFLFSALVSLSILIITGMTMAFYRINEDGLVLGILWLELIILLILSAIYSNRKVRGKRAAFLKVIPHFILAVLPILILITLDEIWDFWTWDYFEKYKHYVYYSNGMDKQWVYNNAYYQMKEDVIFYTVLGSFALYIFVLYPLFIKPGWVKFMALPKKS